MNASTMDINAKSAISLTNLIARFRNHPKYTPLAAGAAGIALAIVLLLWARTPDYRILYSNINDQDGGAVVAKLTTMNIPYRFAGNSGAIYGAERPGPRNPVTAGAKVVAEGRHSGI